MQPLLSEIRLSQNGGDKRDKEIIGRKGEQNIMAVEVTKPKEGVCERNE